MVSDLNIDQVNFMQITIPAKVVPDISIVKEISGSIPLNREIIDKLVENEEIFNPEEFQ